ncbi:hypothetical protein L4X63_23430 [Geomonas sp. Red32]|uniref:hypothetical protein n=1 Tax=Geomonas sp. Red32 TaxID=2912856 RepID=UPI00202CC695|nr:hypothetical protein [Geomonas sp. Red32]MCM0084530.1 hypothetical protein [Geomonas sp. Red32]
MSPDRLPEIDPDTIACQQILEADHSVFSIQWVVIPGGSSRPFSSANLLESYLRYIQRFTAGVIRPVQTAEGVEFRLLASSWALIQFLPPRHTPGAAGDRITMSISGGLLVDKQECDRGQLDFIVEETAAGSRLTLKLADYCPLLLGSRQPSRWRKWLYRFTQAYIHKVVTIKFLAMVYRRITGKKVRRGVVNMVVRKGITT